MYAYDSRPKISDIWELDSWLRRISKSYNYASVITGSSTISALYYCKIFLELTPALRVQLIKIEDRYLRCCVGRHYTRRCTSKVTCLLEDCGKRHHALLHGAENVVKKDDSRKKSQIVQ